MAAKQHTCDLKLQQDNYGLMSVLTCALQNVSQAVLCILRLNTVKTACC